MSGPGPSPATTTISTSPSDWLVQFITPSSGYTTSQQQALQGLPWADGTDMASRYPSTTPWDQGCTVQPYIGSLAAIGAMCADLETVIASAQAGQDNGYAFIADWRFNCLRDLGGAVGGYQPWGSLPATLSAGVTDQTALGLVLRLMQAGVQVWLLLWYPTSKQNRVAGLQAHVADHRYAAAVVGAENERLQDTSEWTTYGAVALDCRVADNGRAAAAAAHHQKFLIIRSGGIHRAYVGGVDLAFTRRDAPVGSGDWQSAGQMPPIRLGWPRQATGVDYSSVDNVVPVTQPDDPVTDLPEVDDPANTTPLTIYGGANHIWHDRHLCLEGPIVQTLDSHFRERWNDAAITTAPLSIATSGGRQITATGLDNNWSQGDVISSLAAPQTTDILPAQPATTSSTVAMVAPPAGQPSPSGGQSVVQMWRTVPLRRSRPATQDYFQRGEFTIGDGLVNAISQSTQLIWIFEQYFWSQPLARLLNARLRTVSSLYVIVVLPPHADGAAPDNSVARAQHLARYAALAQLVQGVSSQVGIYSMWQSPSAGGPSPSGKGIYVHAKSHIYDGTLLVTGSASINRRSLTGDSELMCAVVDQQMTLNVMQALWTQLFPSSPATGPATPGYTPPFPVNTSASNWGATFFTSFATAAASVITAGSSATALLYNDPPPTTPQMVRLPSGAARNLPDDFNPADAIPDWYDWILESSSVDYKALEAGNADLAAIQGQLNNPFAQSDGPVTFPSRQTSWF
jgi:phosphatidylserine/phosphatidylglycerophosphate/cardiolipin synthase-like enzyme